MIRTIEARYLPGCAYVTAASPGIADAYVETYGIARPTVMLNVFPRVPGACLARRRGELRAGTFGLLVLADDRTRPRARMCRARDRPCAQSRPHLYLRGTPAAGFLDHLRKIAGEADALDRLHVLPPAAPSEMERLAAIYDVGLVGETGHTPNRRIALTNKQFTYLMAGIPVVMSDIPAHRDIARAMGRRAVAFTRLTIPRLSPRRSKRCSVIQGHSQQPAMQLGDWDRNASIGMLSRQSY